MSTFSNSEYKLELTAYGYVRSNCHKSIPFDIIDRIKLFYDLYYRYCWHFKDEAFLQFLTSKQNDRFESKIFTANGIRFKCILYPNGLLWDPGYIQFGLQIINIPDDIEFFAMICKLSCPQTETIDIVCDILSNKNKFIAWNTNQPKFSKCKQYIDISFDCLMDIKYIKYKSNMNLFHCNDFIIPSYVEYQWKINRDLLIKVKNGNFGNKIYSKPFGDDHWKLSLTKVENPYYSSKDEHFEIEPILIELPLIKQLYNIHDIGIKFIITATGNVEYITKEFIYNTYDLESNRNGVLIQHIDLKNYVYFGIKLEIIWNKYGIKSTKPNPKGTVIKKGICKKFNVSKGFGFITCNDGTDDIFVHFSEIKGKGFKSLNEGQSVEFQVVVQNDGRRKAINVTGPNGEYINGRQHHTSY